MSRDAMDLSVEVAGLRFPNPLIVGSCSLTSRPEQIEALAEAGAGGIITKTISPDVNLHAPRFQAGRYASGWTCAADPRVTMDDAEALFRRVRRSVKVPVIANVIGRADDAAIWGDACCRLEQAGADAIELDLNCHPEGVAIDVPPELSFLDIYSIGQDAKATARVVAAVKSAVKIPVIAKMTLRAPNVLAVAKASEAAGADIISGMNALPGVPGLDVERGGMSCLDGFEKFEISPILGPELSALGRKWTGLFGKALTAPYISGSGVMRWQDAVERMMLGAHAVSVVSALYYEGPGILRRWRDEISALLARRGHTAISEMRGVALERFMERGQRVEHRVVARVVDPGKWAPVSADIYNRLKLECACIRPDGRFDESACKGCALPSFQAPQAVAMVKV
jgi:dihydroorotate dehydrogenase